MSDTQLFWAGFAVATTALLIGAGALVWPHITWTLQQRRRRPMRRGGSIFQERRDGMP